MGAEIASCEATGENNASRGMMQHSKVAVATSVSDMPDMASIG